ncbi:MAG: hypothetical protein AMS16_05505 [Planctomycetes bacterium DG_58]|nr:MAG: hypothetical protein AMS16_05505 [Planctomycetes bacterium DG_58]
MVSNRVLVILTAVVVVSFPVAAEEAAPTAATAPAPAGKAAPLPFNSIEGVPGAPITPMAYLANPGPEGTRIGMPTLSLTGVSLGSKWLGVFAYNQTFFRRVEVGYAYNYFDLGSLPADVKKVAGLNIRDHVQLHHVNLRGLLVEEDSYGLPLPALTFGVHFKHNSGIRQIDRKLGGYLRAFGYEKASGVDLTLTGTKMFPELALGKPLILTAGLRNSCAAQIGYLGFGDDRETTFEGSVAVLPRKDLLVAYEFRQKSNPYHTFPVLIGREQNWHSVSASWIVNDRLTVTGMLGSFGTIANSRADLVGGLQVKYEF